MKILELFSGYGTASFALKRLGMDYELVGYSDIDKYANQCFKQNHCPDDVEDKLRLSDVTKVNPYELGDFDLLTGGFPCQAFSIAGHQKGELDPRGTLFNEIIKIAEVKKPKYMLLENVKGLTSKKFKDTFDKILSELDRIGYTVYWKVLNSKDFGIPQSRARVWFVCFRKDVSHSFSFPEGVELKIFIKDILEEVVDEKYNLSEKMQQRFSEYLEKKKDTQVINTQPRSEDRPCMVKAREEGRPYPGGCGILGKSDGTVYTIDTGNTQAVKCYDNHRKDEIREYEDVSYTLSQAMGTGGNNVSMVANCICLNSKDENNKQPKIQDRVYSSEGVSPAVVTAFMPSIHNTITQAVGRSGHSKEELGYIEKNNHCGKLRRLTPKECFRLMGFLNDGINLEGLSDTQRYKLAGNGQDVNVVSLIFEKMFELKSPSVF